MVTRSTEVVEQSGHGGIGQAVPAVGGLMLALVVMAGIAGWRLALQRDAAAPTAQQAATTSAPPVTLPVGATILTVYLIESQEQAMLMREGLELANSVQKLGPPHRYAVVIMGTDADVAIRQALKDDASIAGTPGGSSVQVVDLRAGK